MVRIIGLALIYTCVLFVIILIGWNIASQITWYALDPLYHFLLFIQDGLVVILPILLIIGYLVIVFFELRKPYAYLEDVVKGVRDINNRQLHMIHLEHDELRDVNDLLNQTKADIELNEQAAKMAEQKKNDLIVYLAHDLKTPLTSMIGYLTILKDEKDIPQQSHDHYVEIALDKAERLEDLINEFFEITRFNLTQQALELSRIDIVRLLEQLIYEFKPMFKEKNLQCELDAPRSLEMKCDVQKMQRVFDNLLKNAVNYSFENTVIHIHLSQSEKGYEFIFENQGNTIPQAKLDHVFEQFYRLDSSRASNTGGAGLGLSISKAIIEQHHGQIQVESYDEKIIFKVLIPLL